MAKPTATELNSMLSVLFFAIKSEMGYKFQYYFILF
mgnify:CR=1 FL=1